jgi:hypothetical protein
MYWLLRPVNRYLSQLAALFRLTQAAVLGMNLLNHIGVLFLLHEPSYLHDFQSSQLQAGALWLMDMHTYGYLISGVFFGVSCLLSGFLISRSNYMPAIVGVLVMVAGIGYLLDSFIHFLYPEYSQISEHLVVITAIVGEFTLCFWLLIKGVRTSA